MDAIPPEALLASSPPAMAAIAEHLRGIVRRTAPDAIERVRPGWRLIGYDLPTGPRRTAFFAWVAAEPRHVHLGFPQGILMDDPDRVLRGAGITKRARWVTLRDPSEIDEVRLRALVTEAARTVRFGRAERQLRRLAREPTASS